MSTGWELFCMRFIYVHGTGVRRKKYDQQYGLLTKALGERFPKAEFVPCYWGDTYGATLSAEGRSIPPLFGTRAAADDGFTAGTAGPLEQEAAEWMLLTTDPLCELRVLAHPSEADGGLGLPGVRAAGEEVADQLAALQDEPARSDELHALLQDTGLAPHYSPALKDVAGSTEFTEACAAAADVPAGREVATAASRAVVAAALATAGEDALCTGDERDRLVELVGDRLGGSARFPGGRAAAVLASLALRMTTQPVLRVVRGPLTRGTAPELGDILRYQARGGLLRDFVTQLITAGSRPGSANGPTVLIGHSLGGIALVDLCALAAAEGIELPQPLLLVTVGSQAPFLHELGALTGLPPTADALPGGFPRWLNIFDRHDLLAFRAEPVFPDDPRVVDHEVSSRQPFPMSHGAYWKLGAVYDRIAEEIEAPA
ncbi:hypothetical protein [Streptomyces sp. NPDC048637]|uniref:hypothetical protein n=1 Tax=Streptomyces sp. NPDC048637 TaxID=3155636 RepID=UPI003425FF8A